jgi:CheY-like chemotaxis protein
MKLKVLVVEDEPIIALDLERILTNAGHETIGPASTLEQALAYAPMSDVAFVDLGLADGPSGGSLARRLMDRFGIKVIFVTGDSRSVGHGLEGAVEIIGKPFTDDRILAALTKASAV